MNCFAFFEGPKGKVPVRRGADPNPLSGEYEGQRNDDETSFKGSLFFPKRDSGI